MTLKISVDNEKSFGLENNDDLVKLEEGVK